MRTIFNFSFHEEPMDYDDLRKGTDYILSLINDEEGEAKAQLHKFAGHFLRILNQHEDAIEHLKISYKYYHENGLRAQSIELMYRMGVSYYYYEKYNKSEDLLQLAIYLIEKHPSANHQRFEHNIYFYLGMTLKAQGRKSGPLNIFLSL